MLDADGVAEAQGVAVAMLRMARVELDEVPHLPTVAARLIGAPVRRVRMVGQGDLTFFRDEWILRVHRMLAPTREPWVIGHELGHWWFRTQERAPDAVTLEPMCDAIGAALVAPPPAFRAARGYLGDRVHRLAETFSTTQALALLRVGEVTGRPVRLLGPRPRVRGEPFEWGADEATLVKGRLRHIAHPVRLADERLWGLMAN